MNSCDAIDFIILQEAEKPFLRFLECIDAKDLDALSKVSGVCYRTVGGIEVNPFDPGDWLLPEDIPIPLFQDLPMEKYVAQATFSKSYPT